MPLNFDSIKEHIRKNGYEEAYNELKEGSDDERSEALLSILSDNNLEAEQVGRFLKRLSWNNAAITAVVLESAFRSHLTQQGNVFLERLKTILIKFLQLHERPTETLFLFLCTLGSEEKASNVARKVTRQQFPDIPAVEIPNQAITNNKNQIQKIARMLFQMLLEQNKNLQDELIYYAVQQERSYAEKLAFFCNLTPQQQRKLLLHGTQTGDGFYKTDVGKQLLVQNGGICLQAEDKYSDIVDEKVAQVVPDMKSHFASLTLAEKTQCIVAAMQDITPWAEELERLEQEEKMEQEQKAAPLNLETKIPGGELREVRTVVVAQRQSVAETKEPQMVAVTERQQQITKLQRKIDKRMVFINRYWFTILSEAEQIDVLHCLDLSPATRGKLLLSQPPEMQQAYMDRLGKESNRAKKFILARFYQSPRKIFLNRLNGTDLGILLANLCYDNEDLNPKKVESIREVFFDIGTTLHEPDKITRTFNTIIKNGQLELAISILRNSEPKLQKRLIENLEVNVINQLFHDLAENMYSYNKPLAIFTGINLLLLGLNIGLLNTVPMAKAIKVVTIFLGINLPGFLIFFGAVGALIQKCDRYSGDVNWLLLSEHADLRTEIRVAIFCSLPLESQAKYLENDREGDCNCSAKYIDDADAAEYYQSAAVAKPDQALVLLKRTIEQHSWWRLSQATRILGMMDAAYQTLQDYFKSLSDETQRVAFLNTSGTNPLEIAFLGRLINSLTENRSPQGMDELAKLFNPTMRNPHLQHQKALFANLDVATAAYVIASNKSRAVEFLQMLGAQSEPVLARLREHHSNIYASLPNDWKLNQAGQGNVEQQDDHNDLEMQPSTPLLSQDDNKLSLRAS